MRERGVRADSLWAASKCCVCVCARVCDLLAPPPPRRRSGGTATLCLASLELPFAWSDAPAALGAVAVPALYDVRFEPASGTLGSKETLEVSITVTPRLSGTIDDVAALRAGMLHKTERDVVRIALAIAERVLSRELAVDPELLLAMARVAIDRLGDGIAATIHLHPDDHRAMTAVRAKRPDVVPSAVAIESDLTVPRGGCIVRSEFGVIDLGIGAQVSELSRALLGDGSTPSEQASNDGRLAGR